MPGIPNPLPGPIMTSEPGSFARATIVERKPQIIANVLDDNAYPAEIVQGVLRLKAELAGGGRIQPLVERAPGVADWNRELAQHAGKGWLEVPWYFAEAFFYRRLLEAVHYFQPGPWQNVDPFGKQKQRQARADLQSFTPLWEQVGEIPPAERFEILLHSTLWGNRTDLSNFSLDAQASGGLAVSAEQQFILIDHTAGARRRLQDRPRRVDFINDNIGADLISDLALADELLTAGWAQAVVFHLKDHPFFVSDAMPADVRNAVKNMLESPSAGVRALGQRLQRAVEDGRLALESDPFWTGYQMFTRLPERLRRRLSEAGMILVKGDANYRRVLEDRHWPPTTRLEDVPPSLPVPYLLLRTLKSELVVGLQPGEAEALSAEDPRWLINGLRGLIHLVESRNE